MRRTPIPSQVPHVSGNGEIGDPPTPLRGVPPRPLNRLNQADVGLGEKGTREGGCAKCAQHVIERDARCPHAAEQGQQTHAPRRAARAPRHPRRRQRGRRSRGGHDPCPSRQRPWRRRCCPLPAFHVAPRVLLLAVPPGPGTGAGHAARWRAARGGTDCARTRVALSGPGRCGVTGRNALNGVGRRQPLACVPASARWPPPTLPRPTPGVRSCCRFARTRRWCRVGAGLRPRGANHVCPAPPPGRRPGSPPPRLPMREAPTSAASAPRHSGPGQTCQGWRHPG